MMFRADANGAMGIGHWMRCLALAQDFLQRGVRVYWGGIDAPLPLKKKAQEIGISLIPYPSLPIGSIADGQYTRALGLQYRVDWIIADGYSFGADYQRQIQEAGLRLCILDDYCHSSYYWAEVIINMGLEVDENLYSNRRKETRLLLGPKYRVFRREFLALGAAKREPPPLAESILITMGGSDPTQVTLKVVEGILGLPTPYHMKVVIGPACGYTSTLEALAAQNNFIEIIRSPENMASLMAWAHLGISAGGGTLAEMAYMGLPSLFIITAENQASSIHYHHRGTALYLGTEATVTPEAVGMAVASLGADQVKRNEMSQRGRKLMDGRGNERIYRHLFHGDP